MYSLFTLHFLTIYVTRAKTTKKHPLLLQGAYPGGCCGRMFMMFNSYVSWTIRPRVGTGIGGHCLAFVRLAVRECAVGSGGTALPCGTWHVAMCGPVGRTPAHVADRALFACPPASSSRVHRGHGCTCRWSGGVRGNGVRCLLPTEAVPGTA